MTFRLLNGIGSGVDFDFATFSFHVPSVLSAPKAATAATVKIRDTWISIVRICVPFVRRLRPSSRAGNQYTPSAFKRPPQSAARLESRNEQILLHARRPPGPNLHLRRRRPQYMS